MPQMHRSINELEINSVPERDLAGVRVALEDVHDGYGLLHYDPGSHKLPFYDLSISGINWSASESIEAMPANYDKRYEDFIGELVQYEAR